MLLPFSPFPSQINAPRIVLASATTNGEEQQFKRRGWLPLPPIWVHFGTGHNSHTDCWNTAAALGARFLITGRNSCSSSCWETLQKTCSWWAPCKSQLAESTPAPYCSFLEKIEIPGRLPPLSALPLSSLLSFLQLATLKKSMWLPLSLAQQTVLEGQMRTNVYGSW